MNNNNYIYIIIFILIITIIISVDVMASIKIEPARIILKTESGQKETGVIEVINKGEKQVLLQAYLYDWSLDERDGLVTYKPGTIDNSLNNYIKFNPRSFILDKGEKQIVRFTVTTPENLDKELRGVVFFENATDLVEAGTGAMVKTQIGSVIYLIPNKVQYNLDLKEVRFLMRENNNLQRFLVIMENKGKAHLRIYIEYKIINKNSELVEEGNINEYVLLPGFERGLVFSSKNELKPGEYKLFLNYNFLNTGSQKEYEIPFSID